MRNALVHTPAGTAIDVSVSREGEEVSLAVRDHGPGLPEGEQERLFERFWRAEGGRERGRAGAGLGLAIAREVVSGPRRAHSREQRAGRRRAVRRASPRGRCAGACSRGHAGRAIALGGGRRRLRGNVPRASLSFL